MKRIAIAIGTCLLALSATAQNWPTHEVKLIVPGTPGSPPDVIARLLTDGLAARWKQPVVVENRPGAGGMIGVGAIAKAAPDGYTMGIGYNGPVAYGPALYKKMSYDPAKELEAVVMTTSQPNLLVVRADHPARTPKEFAEWARANAAKASYGSGGNGTSTHLTMELFKTVGNFPAVHVPFPNSPQVLVALISGDVHAMMVTEPTVKAMVQAGKVKILAATSKERTSILPDIPTMVESGYPGFEAMGWNGIFVPTGVPRPIVDKISRDVNAVLQDPAVKERIKSMGLIIVGGDAKQFASYVKEDAATWGKIIRQNNLSLD
jgi:tripartite-type tricarboxylate transporter receptor subunit TctC